MRNIYISSDLHLGHANFLGFKNVNGDLIRPFSSVEEMDEYIIEKHNSVVTDQDIWYNLGDVYFGNEQKADENLSRMKGSKRLILGNHDEGKSRVLQKHFQKIMLWRIFKDHNCVLSHVPLHASQMENVYYNLHGHIHQQCSPSDRHINCCVEWHDYTPKPIEEFFKNIPDYMEKKSPHARTYDRLV